MQLVITVRDGATPGEIATSLRFQANLFDGLAPKEASKVTKTSAPPIEDMDEEIVPDEAPMKKAVKKVEAAFDSDATSDDEETESFEDEAPIKKTKKVKDPTYDDVSDACKAAAKRTSFDGVKAILKKKFGTTSLTKIEVEQFAEVIEVMAKVK
jgi:hypothetical protein